MRTSVGGQTSGRCTSHTCDLRTPHDAGGGLHIHLSQQPLAHEFFTRSPLRLSEPPFQLVHGPTVCDSRAEGGDTLHESKHTRDTCPNKRTPLLVACSWLRSLRNSYGSSSRVAVCLGAESRRGVCRCGVGSLHLAVPQSGRLSTIPCNKSLEWTAFRLRSPSYAGQGSAGFVTDCLSYFAPRYSGHSSRSIGRHSAYRRHTPS